jgi:phage-related protein
MAAHLQAIYYRAPDGSEPVGEFIDKLLVEHQVSIDNQIERINMLTPSSPHLPFPHSSQVEGEFRELRCHYGRSLYRIIYRRSRNLVILLHMVAKRTKKIPPEDIKIAKDRWADFKARMDAQKRVPPRAAGHDAP